MGSAVTFRSAHSKLRLNKNMSKIILEFVHTLHSNWGELRTASPAKCRVVQVIAEAINSVFQAAELRDDSLAN